MPNRAQRRIKGRSAAPIPLPDGFERAYRVAPWQRQLFIVRDANTGAVVFQTSCPTLADYERMKRRFAANSLNKGFAITEIDGEDTDTPITLTENNE